MNLIKRLFNIGLCANIQNLHINNKQIGGFYKVIVLCDIQESMKKFYITANSIYGDHVFQEIVFLWRSRKFKTKEETIGYLTKETGLSQKRYPEIYFFKANKIISGEVIEFDEFLNGKWVRSKYKWDWDPISTMRDKY